MKLSIEQLIIHLHLLLFIFVLVNTAVSVIVNKITKLQTSKNVLKYWASVTAVFFLGGLFHSIELLSHFIIALSVIPFYMLLNILVEKQLAFLPLKKFIILHLLVGCSISTLLYLKDMPSPITAIPVTIGGVILLIYGGFVALVKRKQHNQGTIFLLGVFFIFGSFVHATYPISLLNPTLSIAGWILAFFAYQFASPILFAMVLDEISRKEKDKLIKTNIAYERFVPKKLLQLLQKDDITTVELGDSCSQTMTILYAKIKSFSNISSNLSPNDTLDLLNKFYSTLEPIIYKHQGFINNYDEGALTAIFPKSTENSIDASIEIKSSLKDLNHNLNLDGFNSIEMGIGIDSGKSIIGTTGSTNRMKGTVISSSINMAQKLAKLSKKYQATILITGHTLISIEKSDKNKAEFVDNRYFQGRNTPVTIYEITGETDSENITLYSSALKSISI